MTLVPRFSAHLSSLELEGERALVAVSGGPDSVGLLHLLSETREQHRLELIVAHVDHGIHPESGQVAERVRVMAEAYGLGCEVVRLELGPSTSETAARAERYAWLEQTRVRIGADLILTGHHADDQIETVLMRVLAGSGPAGLAGMAGLQGRLVRPLLPFRRAELEEYLRAAGLEAWLDPANVDPRHLRSWIRAELLPLLRRRMPGVDHKLGRVARQAGADRAAWDSVLNVLPGLDPRRDADGISVAAHPLGEYDSSLIQATILALARRAGCQLGPARARRVLTLLRDGSTGDRVPLGGRWTAELSFGRLRLSRAPDSIPDPWLLEDREGQVVWGRWHFRWEPAIAPERQERSALSAWFTLEPLSVRAWAPGDRVKPLGGTGRRLIVRCFQEARVPRSSRDSWPVLTGSDDVLWVPGVCRSGARLPAGGMEALRVDAQYA